MQPFIDAHFSVRGTLSLHRAALGWDFARAPLNLTLAGPQLVLQLGARAAKAVGAGRTARALRRSIMLKTDVEREIEWLVQTELLGLPFRQAGRASHRDALAETILADPGLAVAMRSALAEIGRTAKTRRSRRGCGTRWRIMAPAGRRRLKSPPAYCRSAPVPWR